jgi:hypothetical protein
VAQSFAEKIERKRKRKRKRSFAPSWPKPWQGSDLRKLDGFRRGRA